MIIDSEYLKDITDQERKEDFKNRLEHIHLDTEKSYQEQMNYLWKKLYKAGVLNLDRGMMTNEGSIVGVQYKVIKEFKRDIKKYLFTSDYGEESDKVFIEECTYLLTEVRKKKYNDVIHLFFNEYSGFNLIADKDALHYLKEAVEERGAVL